MQAVPAACERPGVNGDSVPIERHRNQLVERVHATGPRMSVISGEFLADAPDEATARRIVAQLGADRTHVLVTLRPPARILPSQWATVRAERPVNFP